LALRGDARTVGTISALVAVGAAVRIVLGRIALASPTAVYGVLIKVGLSETLAFVSGVVFGPIHGFITGMLTIVISDLFMIPGPWTPFISAIIGVVGFGGGLLNMLRVHPSRRIMIVSAILLTFVSEILQNLWVALFFGVPVVAAIVSGAPSLISALINNVVLFSMLGPRVIRTIRDLVPLERQQPELLRRLGQRYCTYCGRNLVPYAPYCDQCGTIVRRSVGASRN